MPHLGVDRTPSEPRTSSSFPRGENRFWATALDTGSYAGYGSVTLGVSTRVNITAGGRYTWETKVFDNEGGSQDGYALVDTFLAYETLNGRWRISLSGENLTDEVYLTGALYSAGLRMSPGFLNPPRRS